MYIQKRDPSCKLSYNEESGKVIETYHSVISIVTESDKDKIELEKIIKEYSK